MGLTGLLILPLLYMSQRIPHSDPPPMREGAVGKQEAGDGGESEREREREGECVG